MAAIALAVRRVSCCLVAFFLLLPPAVGEDLKIDHIVVKKAQRRMDLMSGDHVMRTYAIALGSSPVGDKRQEGDGRTPEGKYRIAGRNASSAYHRSLRISYPDATDLADAAARGVKPGGDIFIHGMPNWWSVPGAAPVDWTRGCIAVSKAEIEEIWDLVPDGTLIEIEP